MAAWLCAWVRGQDHRDQRWPATVSRLGRRGDGDTAVLHTSAQTVKWPQNVGCAANMGPIKVYRLLSSAWPQSQVANLCWERRLGGQNLLAGSPGSTLLSVTITLTADRDNGVTRQALITSQLSKQRQYKQQTVNTSSIRFSPHKKQTITFIPRN